LLNNILAKFLWLFAATLNATYRYRYIGFENIKDAQKNSLNGNYIYAIWHQQFLQGNLAQKNIPHVVLVSKSKDADLIAYTCKKLGFIACRGSSMKSGVDKGGKAAKEEMINLMKSGIAGAITVDGPKGPARMPKSGIIDMAKKSGHPIIPYSAVAQSYWEFNSWDKFRLPKPFSKIMVMYGVPIMVAEDADYEQFNEIKMHLKEVLDTNEVECRQFFNNGFKNHSNVNYHKVFNENS
jgi:lysophospholipid acyltransferase (LPLAT)-like uncharacterized protein